ncbi:MAG TPA: hypothetical protein VMH85_09540 [Terriglobales bacterium]|nr:hypothetical protein [Terriglobales bacterium]
MNDDKTHTCSICGEIEADTGDWFLVSENHLEDKLQILHWSRHLAGRAGIHPACSAAHVQELVVHWMTTGSLDYPFAMAKPIRVALQRGPGGVVERETRRFRPIGELAVDRESMKRVLNESPHSLRTILDALLRALQEPNLSLGTELEADRELVGAVSWEV